MAKNVFISNMVLFKFEQIQYNFNFHQMNDKQSLLASLSLKCYSKIELAIFRLQLIVK